MQYWRNLNLVVCYITSSLYAILMNIINNNNIMAVSSGTANLLNLNHRQYFWMYMCMHSTCVCIVHVCIYYIIILLYSAWINVFKAYILKLIMQGKIDYTIFVNLVYINIYIQVV